MAVIYAALPIGLLVGTLMPWVPADKLGPDLAGARSSRSS